MKTTIIKGKALFLVAIIVCLMLCAVLCMGNGKRASAAEVDDVTIEDVTPDETSVNEDEAVLDGLVSGFLARLKAKYGEDYETYYNAIIAKWGSVEEYLLSLADGSEDPAATGWRAFVRWLGENSPVWASILAVVLIIILILCGRAALNKLFSWLNSKKKTAVQAVNTLYEAQIVQMQALKKLFGDNPKFEAERAALDAAVEKLKEENE